MYWIQHHLAGIANQKLKGLAQSDATTAIKGPHQNCTSTAYTRTKKPAMWRVFSAIKLTANVTSV
jgi:hypothetical protein